MSTAMRASTGPGRQGPTLCRRAGRGTDSAEVQRRCGEGVLPQGLGEEKSILLVFNQCLLPEDEPYWPLWVGTFCEETKDPAADSVCGSE